ncbi:MAG: hypothetical protein AAB795_03895 [Patescibacteria group bacterium]
MIESNDIFSSKFWHKDEHKPKYNFESIENLEKPIKEILKQLHDKINLGNYGLIIGDDASGRIPTLLVNKIISTLYKERGLPVPKNLFFAGTGQLSSEIEKIQKQDKIAKILHTFCKKHRAPKCAIIITDTIASGNSLVPLTCALKDNGIEYDIATVGLTQFESKEKRKLYKKLGSEIVYGSDITPDIYGIYSISGVEKSITDTFSRPYKQGKNKHKQQNIQKNINLAREDVALLSKELICWYKDNF